MHCLSSYLNEKSNVAQLSRCWNFTGRVFPFGLLIRKGNVQIKGHGKERERYGGHETAKPEEILHIKTAKPIFFKLKQFRFLIQSIN